MDLEPNIPLIERDYTSTISASSSTTYQCIHTESLIRDIRKLQPHNIRHYTEASQNKDRGQRNALSELQMQGERHVQRERENKDVDDGVGDAEGEGYAVDVEAGAGFCFGVPECVDREAGR
jgi:hypothetical protein